MVMESNFSTFSRISEERKFEGQWVVILKDKVVANGTAKDVKERMNLIRKEYPNEVPMIAKIPKRVLQIV